MAFPEYRFEHPHLADQIVTIGGWSYLWAGLFGCFYVFAWGSPRHFLKALAISLACLVLLAAILALAAMVPSPVQLGILLVAVPLLVFVQGLAMVGLVRDSYRRRGWWVQRA